MARLLVLRFEDDTEAEYFIKWAKVQSNIVGRATIEMMVQTPTKFCECTARPKHWRRGEKRGWQIHNECGRPSIGWASNPRAVIGTAIDFLEKPTKQNSEERHQKI